MLYEILFYSRVGRVSLARTVALVVSRVFAN